MSVLRYAILSLLLAFSLAIGLTELQARQSPNSIETLFPMLRRQQLNGLNRGEAIKRRYSSASDVQLTPHTVAGQRVDQSIERLSPSFGVEALYFYQNPDIAGISSLQLFNLTRAISTMEGLEYTVEFSSDRRTLYRQSYAVEGPNSNRPIADPVLRRVPDEVVMYAVQDDTGFGRNTYRVVHRHNSGVIHIEMQNLTTVRMGFIPVIRPDNFLLHFILIPTDGGVLFYANGAMQVGGFMRGFEGRAQEGLAVRIDALYDWFRTQVDTEINATP